jgi:hypothetical protein
VTPRTHAGRGLRARFEDHEVDAAFDEVRGGREPDRAGADDGDGKRRKPIGFDHPGCQIKQSHSILQRISMNVDTECEPIYRHLSISTSLDI